VFRTTSCVPHDARAAHAPQVADPGRERQEHVRLHQALPKTHHLLAGQQAHQVHLLALEHRDGARQQLRCVCRVGVGEQQQLAPGGAVTLNHGPGLSEPPRRQLGAAQQPQSSRRLRSAGEAIDDVAGAVGGAVVHHDHLERRVSRRQHGPHTARDVLRLIAGGDDHGDERAGGLRGIVGEPGSTPRVPDHDERQQQEVGTWEEPDHVIF